MFIWIERALLHMTNVKITYAIEKLLKGSVERNLT